MEKLTETALVVGEYALRVEFGARLKNVAVEQRKLWASGRSEVSLKSVTEKEAIQHIQDAIDDKILY